MNFDEFVKETMADRHPELDIRLEQVEKLQGQSYVGLMVKRKLERMGAMIRLDGIPQDPLERALNEVEKLIEEAMDRMDSIPAVGGDTELVYENLREKLIIQLIGINQNQEMLKKVPHKTLEDMAIVYRIEWWEGATTLITDEMIRAFGITAEELHEDAMKSQTAGHFAVLKNIADMINDMFGYRRIEEPQPLWVATLEPNAYGAAVITYHGFLKKAAEQIGEDLFILPSSLYEVILVADDGKVAAEDLRRIVTEINIAEVNEEDKLTDSVYRYGRSDGCLRKVE